MSKRIFSAVKQMGKQLCIVKNRPLGQRHIYKCHKVRMNKICAVGLWVPPVGNPWGVPVDAWSFGVWWKGSNMASFRLHRFDSQIHAYRFDVVENVKIEEDEVQFMDLFLDGWIYPTTNVPEKDKEWYGRRQGRLLDRRPVGELRLEDEEELEEAKRQDAISDSQKDILNSVTTLFLHDPEKIVCETDLAIDWAIQHI